MLIPFNAVAFIVFIAFVLNYFLHDFILFISDKSLLSLKKHCGLIFSPKSAIFLPFFPFHVKSLLWEMGPQVHQKVFNIYSLLHLSFFFNNLLHHHFISYLILDILAIKMGCCEVYWMCLLIRGAMPANGVCRVLPFKLWD